MATPYKQQNLAGIVANVANGTDGNAVTTHYYLAGISEGYKNHTIILTLENTTITLFGSADDDTVALASMTWRDITNTLFGINNLTNSGEFIIDTNIAFSRLRITALTTNATNSRQIRVAQIG